jgi:hypothetical protein
VHEVDCHAGDNGGHGNHRHPAAFNRPEREVHMTHDQQLAAVRARIEEGERQIEKQRLAIKELERSGYSTLVPKLLLKEIEADLRADYATHSFLMRREAAPHLVAARIHHPAIEAGVA